MFQNISANTDYVDDSKINNKNNLKENFINRIFLNNQF